MNELGLTKEGILGQFANCSEKQNKDPVQNYDDNEILSDSDPEGDKLDVKDLLGKCQNKMIQKKFQQEFKSKTAKDKKGKEKNLSNARCLSNKHMR